MSKKRKLIDLEIGTVIKLTELALRNDSDLKNYCQKVLIEVGNTGAFNTAILKNLKVLIIDTERCDCISPISCELCDMNSAYNIFKRKIITLVSEIEQNKL